jgi:uncharacterized repeat protein (TIGR03803 family)
MSSFHAWKRLYVLFLFCSLTSSGSPAQVFKSLANFEGSDGEYPLAKLTQGVDGSLYGTTNDGSDNDGTVFKITRAGALTTIYSFCTSSGCPDGSHPNGLVLGTDGNFYGTTYGGGPNEQGTVFKITPTGTLTTLYSFCANPPTCRDGALPQAPLILASDGNFYGSTTTGGTGDCSGGCGTIFKITPAGRLTTLHSFTPLEGWYPNGVIQATNGQFYGTAYNGGANCSSSGGCGTVFEMTLGGSLRILYSFCARRNCSDGNGPTSLIQARDGNFYGTTVSGGIRCNQSIPACGTVFKITPRGNLTTLHRFDLTDGANPNGAIIQATDGFFYGTTWYGGNTTACPGIGCGTVFRMTLSGTVTTLHSFVYTDGAVPFAGLLQATNGVFYGNASSGGDLNCTDFEGQGCGTVFDLRVGLKPFVAFVIKAGGIGQRIGILGQGFIGTTAVSFNGTAARFTVRSQTLLTAIVPAGATTGSVTVTTPDGTLTSNVPFYVLP